jgi:hypothetical protein
MAQIVFSLNGTCEICQILFFVLIEYSIEFQINKQYQQIKTACMLAKRIELKSSKTKTL